VAWHKPVLNRDLFSRSLPPCGITGRRFMRSNSAILLVTCAIALAAPAAGGESNKPGEGPNITVVQLMGTWKVSLCPFLEGLIVGF
jgi:hypothetical protein